MSTFIGLLISVEWCHSSDLAQTEDICLEGRDLVNEKTKERNSNIKQNSNESISPTRTGISKMVVTVVM